MVKIAGRSNDNMTLVSETLHKQNHCRNHKAALSEKPTDLQTLHNDSSFTVQSNSSVLRTRATLPITIRIT